MIGIGKWIMGSAMGLLALIGLFLASAASDGTMYGVGLLLFVFGVLFIFRLIGRYTGGAAH